MKLNWNLNTQSDSLISMGNEHGILATVYRCIVTKEYVQIVWVCGESKVYSKSIHNCCIAAMVHAEAAATELADEITLQSAVWQEV